MKTDKLFPLPIFRIAVWTEETRVPNKCSTGKSLIGGGSRLEKVERERLEQKFMDHDGVTGWFPIEKVFIEQYCTKVEKQNTKCFTVTQEDLKILSDKINFSNF